MASGAESWIGSSERFGIVQRLAIALFVLSAVIALLSFFTPGHASIRYAMFVAAHSLLYTGFVVGALADSAARRTFSFGRLLFAALFGFTLGVLGPVSMSAAAATMH